MSKAARLSTMTGQHSVSVLSSEEVLRPEACARVKVVYSREQLSHVTPSTVYLPRRESRPFSGETDSFSWPVDINKHTANLAHMGHGSAHTHTHTHINTQ